MVACRIYMNMKDFPYYWFPRFEFPAKTPLRYPGNTVRNMAFFSHMGGLLRPTKGLMFQWCFWEKPRNQKFWQHFLLHKPAKNGGKSWFPLKTAFAEIAVAPKLLDQSQWFFGVFLIIYVPNFWQKISSKIEKKIFGLSVLCRTIVRCSPPLFRCLLKQRLTMR